jgi:TIGR03009 family protein
MSIRQLRFSGILWLLMAMVSLVVAQPTSPPPAPVANEPALNQLLAMWERDMGTMQSLVVEFNCTRTYTDQGNIKKEFVGSLRCMKMVDGSFGATIQLRRANGTVAEQYICTSTHIYNVWPEDKTVYVYTLPPRQPGQPPDDGPLPFLTGMKSKTARERYRLKAYDSEDPKYKPWYTYVDVLPNFDRDLQDFTYARLSILKQPIRDQQGVELIPVGMPRQLLWFEPNKNKTTWDVLRVQRNVPESVSRREFEKPTFPQGWKIENLSKAASGPSTNPPRVIRNQEP